MTNRLNSYNNVSYTGLQSVLLILCEHCINVYSFHLNEQIKALTGLTSSWTSLQTLTLSPTLVSSPTCLTTLASLTQPSPGKSYLSDREQFETHCCCSFALPKLTQVPKTPCLAHFSSASTCSHLRKYHTSAKSHLSTSSLCLLSTASRK